MNTCGLTRLLVPGFLVGLAVATFAGNDLYGWIAAAATIAVVSIVQRFRGSTASCAVSAERAPGSPVQADLRPRPDAPRSGPARR